MTSIQELLAQYQQGAMSRDALQTQIEQADTEHITHWMTEVHTATSAGRITEPLARDLLELLTAANEATRVAEDETRAKALSDETLMRPAMERTVALPPADATAILTDDDQTAARTLRAPPIKTLVRPEGFSAGELPGEPPAEPIERTQIITERLVRSLDEAEAPPHRGPLEPGSVIKSRFVLEHLIGKGGMGLVFAALDRRKQEVHDPNPRVALKVLNADFQQHPQSLIALQREARKAQTLAHPNVVTVFDFDRDGDAVYMTMELLKGRPLEALVREVRGKGMEPAKALPIVRGIAQGLAYAHRKGIVHSDLKPGNVFVIDDGTPKILDFGIARAVPNAPGDAAQDIFDAGSLGAYTEAYATDEMVEGVDPHPADDMFALGIIGYELITGFHPYQRHSAVKAREMGLKPPPLKGLKLREARALERCLSFDRKQRPQDATEFLKAFRGVSKLQKITLAAAAVLAIAAGYFSYENYRETTPTVAFNQLSPSVQEEFTQAMQLGNEEWAYYQREGNIVQLHSAVAHYAEAYALHERNRDATKALNKVADAWLTAAKHDPELRREVARTLQEYSDYYYRYDPVSRAAR